MSFEELENNPIFVLGKYVLVGKFSLEQALNNAESIKFIKNVSKEHCEEIARFVEEIQHKDPLSAFIYSSLGLFCTDTKHPELKRWALENYFLADELGEKDLFGHLLQPLNICNKIFRKLSMHSDAASFDKNMARIYLKLGQYDKALVFLQSARMWYKDLNDKINLAFFLNFLYHA